MIYDLGRQLRSTGVVIWTVTVWYKDVTDKVPGSEGGGNTVTPPLDHLFVIVRGLTGPQCHPLLCYLFCIAICV